MPVWQTVLSDSEDKEAPPKRVLVVGVVDDTVYLTIETNDESTTKTRRSPEGKGEFAVELHSLVAALGFHFKDEEGS